MEFIQGLLQNNPYFTAGFGLVGIGALAAAARRSVQMASIVALRNYTMTLEVPSHDKSYHWLLQWIIRNSRRSAQHMSVETHFEQNEVGRTITHYQFIPSTGVHFFWYQKYLIRVERTRAKQMTGNLSVGVTPFETVTLTTYGQQRELFMQILDEARSMALQKQEGWTIVFKSFASEWRPFGHPRKRRPIDSVVLAENQAETILTDIREFADMENWYRERGIPYRRGYLLHGPPGCGKSSFITALAGALEYNVCVLSLNEGGITSDRLDHLLTHAPQQAIILLEDIDAAVVNRHTQSPEEAIAYQGMQRLCLSGLLNAIDGVTSTEGRILFMTTNYIERLDPALIRPGRVDLQVHIGLCSLYQLKRLFLHFFPQSSEELAEEFAHRIGPDVLSPAEVQGHFLLYKHDASLAIEESAHLVSQKLQRATS